MYNMKQIHIHQKTCNQTQSIYQCISHIRWAAIWLPTMKRHTVTIFTYRHIRRGSIWLRRCQNISLSSTWISIYDDHPFGYLNKNRHNIDTYNMVSLIRCRGIWLRVTKTTYRPFSCRNIPGYEEFDSTDVETCNFHRQKPIYSIMKQLATCNKHNTTHFSPSSGH